MMIPRLRTRIHPRRGDGQALAEFAVAAPIIFIVLLGLFDAGRLVFINNEMAEAAREGARWGAVQGRAADEAAGDNTAVTDKVGSHIVVTPGPAISLSCTDLRPGGASCASGDLLTINVSATVRPITPLVGDILGPVVLTSEARMTVH